MFSLYEKNYYSFFLESAVIFQPMAISSPIQVQSNNQKCIVLNQEQNTNIHFPGEDSLTTNNSSLSSSVLVDNNNQDDVVNIYQEIVQSTINNSKNKNNIRLNRSNFFLIILEQHFIINMFIMK